MPNYLSPGVYVEETPPGSRPIEGVGTSVAAFVGFAEMGPRNRPVLITNWSQYRAAFGDFMPGSYLAHAVYGYFNNGGGSCYVVRIGGEGQSNEATGVLPSRRLRARSCRARVLVTCDERTGEDARTPRQAGPVLSDRYWYRLKIPGRPAVR